jgi:hypothetical protein
VRVRAADRVRIVKMGPVVAAPEPASGAAAAAAAPAAAPPGDKK